MTLVYLRSQSLITPVNFDSTKFQFNFQISSLGEGHILIGRWEALYLGLNF